jgi:toluene monooxygenase system protein B
VAPFPVVGRFVGDFVPFLVAVDTEDTMDVVAEKVAEHSVGRRIPRPDGPPQYDVFLDDRRLDPAAKVGDLALLPLQWLDVAFRGGVGG